VRLLVNVIVAWIMIRGADTKENLNMRGAFLHVLSDMLGSIGANVAALLIIFFDWGWADPVASVIVAILVLRSGYITKSSIHVLMEGAPNEIDINDVNKIFEETVEIKSIHDLHIWTMTSGLNALSCHAVVDKQLSIDESEVILRKIEHDLEHKCIKHVTIQLETSAHQHVNSILCLLNYEPTGHYQHHH
jgi:cobalt-zinc-cadmium efflux system protein